MKVTINPKSPQHKEIAKRLGPEGWVVLVNKRKDADSRLVIVSKSNKLLGLTPEEIS